MLLGLMARQSRLEAHPRQYVISQEGDSKEKKKYLDKYYIDTDIYI